jgi:hypothetical protein
MSCQIVAGKGERMKTAKQNRLAILGAKDGQFPKHAISLLEIMREFSAWDINLWTQIIDSLKAETIKPFGTVLPKSKINGIRSYLLDGKLECLFRELDWREAESTLFALNIPICKIAGQKSEPISAERVRIALGDLRLAISQELKKRKFAMIENKKADFFEMGNQFGEEVSRAFPSVKEEIRQAGNCLALDLNTAAIFHLMRVAELGMRSLARRLKVKCKKNSIDSGGWSEIITGIENATAARWLKAPKAKSARRKAVSFLKLCEVSADELNVFKEVWRNNVMHAGQLNNEHEAHGVYIRVRDFMQRLSTQVSESNS